MSALRKMFLVVVMLAGLCLLAYPHVASWLFERAAVQVTESYDETVASTSEQDLEAAWAKAVVDIDEGKDGTMISGMVESPDTYQAISYDIGSYYTLDTSFTEANEVAMKSGYYCKGTAIVLAKLIAANDSGYVIQVYKEDYTSISIDVAPSQVKKTSKEEVADAIVRLGTENADVKASIDWYNSIYPSYSSSSSYSSAT